jgi:hypothetical protein
MSNNHNQLKTYIKTINQILWVFVNKKLKLFLHMLHYIAIEN